ncbi:MAG: hypothetical protein CMJ67_02275 [Planctomycetaceae bacterium]|nr:hypothetical protein [Planctomycetaceae bacterium]
MNPLARYPRQLRVEVCLALAAYAVALQTFQLGFILAVAAIASGYISEGPRGRTLPGWVVTIMALGITGWIVLIFLDNPDPEVTMALIGRLSCLIATLRLFERRKAKDDRQIVVLCVVAVVAAALYSFQLLFGVLVIAFAAQTIRIIMLNRLRTGFEAARTIRQKIVATTPVPPLEVPTGRAPVMQFRLLGVVCTLAAFLAASMVFVIFPRNTGAQGRLMGMRTGFAPRVELGRADQIEQSNREVFTVQWSDPRGEPIKWPQPLLLRGVVLGEWDPVKHEWVRAESRRGRRWWSRSIETNDSIDDFARLGSLAPSRTTYTQTVRMRSLATPQVFAHWAPVAIACDESRTFLFNPETFELTETDTGRFGRFSTYRLKVLPSPNQQELLDIAGGSLPSDRPQTRGFPVPGVREEAERILRERAPELLEPLDPDTPEAVWQRSRRIADVFTDYLRGPDFKYTLDLRRVTIRTDRDPILTFLLDQRFGHCQYFASALCALCQSMRIDSRVVTGFVAVEYDDTLDHYVVRESNAHAWVEVRVGPINWRQFDPTSTEVLEELQAGRRSWADEFRWIYDRFDFLWNSRIVAFDGDDQATLAEEASVVARNRAETLLEWVKRTANRVNRYFMLGPAGYIWLGVVFVVLVVGVLTIITVVRRRRMIRAVIGKASPRVAREAGFYLDLLDAFARAGFPKPSYRSPRNHVDFLREIRPDLAKAAAPLVDLFYEIRFGDRRLGPDSRRRAEAEARELLVIAERDEGDIG